MSKPACTTTRKTASKMLVSMLKYYLRSIAVLSCFILTSHSWTFLPIFFLSTFMVTDIFLYFKFFRKLWGRTITHTIISKENEQVSFSSLTTQSTDSVSSLFSSLKNIYFQLNTPLLIFLILEDNKFFLHFIWSCQKKCLFFFYTLPYWLLYLIF